LPIGIMRATKAACTIALDTPGNLNSL
jgi:hypothetical protein